jgi:type II secretory pathway pseudopilin PulG
MFSLIVTIIAIALLAALAAAAIYYGGSQYVEQKTTAKAAAMVGTASQIEGAVSLYKSDHQGVYPANLQELIDTKYLSTPPSGTWIFQNDYVVKQGVPQNECLTANKAVNIDTIPACNDPGRPVGTVCCSTLTP